MCLSDHAVTRMRTASNIRTARSVPMSRIDVLRTVPQAIAKVFQRNSNSPTRLITLSCLVGLLVAGLPGWGMALANILLFRHHDEYSGLLPIPVFMLATAIATLACAVLTLDKAPIISFKSTRCYFAASIGAAGGSVGGHLMLASYALLGSLLADDSSVLSLNVLVGMAMSVIFYVLLGSALAILWRYVKNGTGTIPPCT